MSDIKKEHVMKGGLKLKKGTNLFKKPKNVDIRKIDITIKKDEEATKKTKTELSFKKRQHETAFERLSKKAAVSHREKVEQFNKQMEELTEFNDIPKVSWTK
uniref:Protein FAM32A n=1 Tax=Acrobeloides nanus TaxID=290746 RepID=A0A914EMC6_9BILA